MPGATPSTDPTTPGDPATMARLSRRVAIGGGLAVTAGLAAACSVGGSDPEAGAGIAGGTGSAATASAGAGTAADAIVALDQIPVGGAVPVTIDGQPAVVARPKDSTVAAFSARCTHMGCTVAVAGARLQCPCHGSQFDALTGAVLRGPASKDLPAIAVRLDGDEVVAG